MRGPQIIGGQAEAFVEFTQDTHHVEEEEEEFDGDTFSSRSESKTSVVQSLKSGARARDRDDISTAELGTLARVVRV